MSVSYYLVCRAHNEAVFITNSNGEQFVRNDVREFWARHVYPGCKITLEDEHAIGWDNIPTIGDEETEP